MKESLVSLLRRRSVEALIQDAELVRDWADGNERVAGAQRIIREAMYRSAIQQLAHEEKARIFALLDFAMPTEVDIEEPDTAVFDA